MSVISATPPPTEYKVQTPQCPRHVYGESRIRFGVREDTFQRQSIQQENRSLYPRLSEAEPTVPSAPIGSSPRRFGMHRGVGGGQIAARPYGAGTILGIGTDGVQFPVTGAQSTLKILGEHAVRARAAAEVKRDGPTKYPFQVSSYRAYHT
mmetsp:Transcript_5308/g.12779  ORF Transcript_5308/g.12779 Transcript_5308/m.12779 type:complete len:151 (-) Transcript_5308:81-533(-)